MASRTIHVQNDENLYIKILTVFISQKWNYKQFGGLCFFSMLIFIYQKSKQMMERERKTEGGGEGRERNPPKHQTRSFCLDDLTGYLEWPCEESLTTIITFSSSLMPPELGQAPLLQVLEQMPRAQMCICVHKKSGWNRNATQSGNSILYKGLCKAIVMIF